MNIEDVYRIAREYLAATALRYRPGQDEYYARVALEQALVAGAAGNFGIGAAAVVRTGPTVAEYRAGTALFTAAGVSDHAEVRALTKWRTGQPPDDQYARSPRKTSVRLSKVFTSSSPWSPARCECAP